MEVGGCILGSIPPIPYVTAPTVSDSGGPNDAETYGDDAADEVTAADAMALLPPLLLVMAVVTGGGLVGVWTWTPLVAVLLSGLLPLGGAPVGVDSGAGPGGMST